MLAQSMRPKLKADTYCLPISDGVYLRGNNNRLVLKGKSLYPLLEHLVPNLDGNVTLEEITEGLDAARKRMLTNLIEKLFAHHFLTDPSQDQLHTLRSLELETYVSNIAFIQSFQTSAAYRFEWFRNKHLLIIGDEPGCISLVQASHQCGVKKISVIVTPEDEITSHFRQDGLDLLANDDFEENAHLIDPPSWDDEAEVRNTIQAYDAVLHIAERPMLARARLLNKLCVEQGKTLIQAITIDDYAWIGPLVCPEIRSCWECAWRRLQANLTDSDLPAHYEFRDLPPASSNRSLTAPGASIIANRLLFELFRYFTQTGSTEITGKISAIDLKTFQSESHAFLPHPHCLASQHAVAQTASQFLEQIQHLQHQSPIDPDIFLENFASCVNERSGLFTTVENSHFVQIPLAVYKVNLSNLLSREDLPEPLNAVGVSIDARDARIRVAQKACERYAANFMDQRRLLPPEAVQQHACSVISTEQLIGQKVLLAESEMWTWTLDLQTQQVSIVPATHIFSSRYEQEQGIGSGKTWEEAICQALLDWCRYLTVEQLKNAQQAYPQVDLERTCMTPEGVHLYRLLKAAGERITAYDVTGSLHVPTFAVCSGKKVVAYSTHCDGTQALSLGLEQALQQYQSTQFQQPDYALAPIPDFPVNLRGDKMPMPRYTLSDAWSARQEWLLQQLQVNGLRALATPLDHDPALAQVLPFIVRVLLSRRELKKGE
jgi:putative thiazole-containing bacteriocin maturation protein